MPPTPRPKLTHFLLLPLVTPTSRPQLQSSLQRLTAEVTAPSEAGKAFLLPAKAIRPVGAIHLTIGVMSLLTPDRVDAACAYLKSLDINSMLRAASASVFIPPTSTPPPTTPTLTPVSAASSSLLPAVSEPTDASLLEGLPAPPPLSLLTSLTGLHTHRPSHSTSSLHALPSPQLDPFAQALHTAFTTAAFLLPDPRPLSLHATLVNTIYSRTAQSGKNRWRKGSQRFDATALLGRFEACVWARDFRVEKVAICEMGAKEVGVEGESEAEAEMGLRDQVYKEIASVELP